MASLAVIVASLDTLGCLVVAFFYFRVWKKMRDSLYGSLASAFVLLAADELGTVLGRISGQETATPEFFRLAAFALLTVTILVKSLATASA